MKSDHASVALEKISMALGVSQSVFFDPLRERANNSPNEALQALELVTNFSKIRNPEVRLACLEFVRDQAAGELASIGDVIGDPPSSP